MDLKICILTSSKVMLLLLVGRLVQIKMVRMVDYFESSRMDMFIDFRERKGKRGSKRDRSVAPVHAPTRDRTRSLGALTGNGPQPFGVQNDMSTN